MSKDQNFPESTGAEADESNDQENTPNQSSTLSSPPTDDLDPTDLSEVRAYTRNFIEQSVS